MAVVHFQLGVCVNNPCTAGTSLFVNNDGKPKCFKEIIQIFVVKAKRIEFILEWNLVNPSVWILSVPFSLKGSSEFKSRKYSVEYILIQKVPRLSISISMRMHNRKFELKRILLRIGHATPYMEGYFKVCLKLETKRIEYILEWNLLEKSVKRPFCCTVSILQVYFTYVCL